MDRTRNEEVRRRAGIGRELASRVDQRVLRWFGHLERMDESLLALIHPFWLARDWNKWRALMHF